MFIRDTDTKTLILSKLSIRIVRIRTLWKMHLYFYHPANYNIITGAAKNAPPNRSVWDSHSRREDSSDLQCVRFTRILIFPSMLVCSLSLSLFSAHKHIYNPNMTRFTRLTPTLKRTGFRTAKILAELNPPRVRRLHRLLRQLHLLEILRTGLLLLRDRLDLEIIVIKLMLVMPFKLQRRMAYLRRISF